MKTLVLKKECEGYYSNQIGSIRISVSNYKGFWTGAIENLDASNDEFLVCSCHGQTKKEVVEELTKFIINF